MLLGESHFIFNNGIQKGLIDNGVDVVNVSLGGTPALQNLYELIRKKNIIKNADLIISGSNTHDILQYNSIDLFKISYQVINWLYKELFFLNKKIIIFLGPTPQKRCNEICIKLVNNLHRKLAIKYGFNVIDFNRYYTEKSLYDFIRRDEAHDFDFIMRELGKNIVKEINIFQYPKKINLVNDNPRFSIIQLDEIKTISYENLSNKQNSLYSENIYILKDRLDIKNEFKNYILLGIHIWNDTSNNNTFEIISDGCDYCILKTFNYTYMILFDIYKRNFVISDNLTIRYTNGGYTNLIGFILASPEGNYHNEEVDFHDLASEDIKIPKEYDFNHLIPNIEWYKEIIDEYCAIMNPKKHDILYNQINYLQNSIKENSTKLSQTQSKLSFQTKYGTAKTRIHNHLSYKLGQAMIENSKSLLGYIRMPYVLSYIKDKHKQEQQQYQEAIKKNPNLKLPNLESYPDYKESLKEKECLTYKLGEAFIKASKTWYKGGYVKLWFEVRKLKGEYIECKR